jgi:hypothetical protein
MALGSKNMHATSRGRTAGSLVEFPGNPDIRPLGARWTPSRKAAGSMTAALELEVADVQTMAIRSSKNEALGAETGYLRENAPQVSAAAAGV